MNHIDLFSGIGGFSWAAKQVWGDALETLFFCDNNKFCQAVLRKNFGADSLIYGDIREVTVERFIADTNHRRQAQQEQQTAGNKQCDRTAIADTKKRGLPISRKSRDGREGLEDSVDLLTGGFPCQPFSAAGKRKGRDDDRHLWPEMFRVITAFKPRYVIAENVRGLVNIENGMALEQVFLDLESIGYSVQAFIIPACAVNAPHRRDRVWIVANNQRGGCKSGGERGGMEAIFRERENDAMPLAESDRHAADAGEQELQKRDRGYAGGTGSDGGTVADGSPGSAWQQPWLEVATRLCRVDDGLPAGVDGLKLSKSKHREERLKALGNSIVPQVAMQIMEAIKNAM